MSRDLQQRYRRLLVWYPREHRETYQEEMLGVLLDGAGPDRTRPTRAETTSLIVGGLRTRLRGTRTWFAREPWRDALAVAAVLTPAVLLVARVDGMLERLGVDPRLGGAVPPRIGPSVWLPVVAWAIATLAVLAGPRAAAIAACWSAVAVEAGVQGLTFWRFGAMTPVTPWPWYAALLAAAAVTAGVHPRTGLRLLGRRAVAVLAATCAVLVIGLLLRAYAPDLPGRVGLTLRSPWAAVVAVLLVAACLRPLAAPLRGRLLAVFAPLAPLAALGEVNRQPYEAFMAAAPAGHVAVHLVVSLGFLVVLVAASAGSHRRPGATCPAPSSPPGPGRPGLAGMAWFEAVAARLRAVTLRRLGDPDAATDAITRADALQPPGNAHTGRLLGILVGDPVAAGHGSAGRAPRPHR